MPEVVHRLGRSCTLWIMVLRRYHYRVNITSPLVDPCTDSASETYLDQESVMSPYSA